MLIVFMLIVLLFILGSRIIWRCCDFLFRNPSIRFDKNAMTHLVSLHLNGAGDGSAHACVSKQGAQVLRVIAQNLAAKVKAKIPDTSYTLNRSVA